MGNIIWYGHTFTSWILPACWALSYWNSHHTCSCSPSIMQKAVVFWSGVSHLLAELLSIQASNCHSATNSFMNHTYYDVRSWLVARFAIVARNFQMSSESMYCGLGSVLWLICLAKVNGTLSWLVAWTLVRVLFFKKALMRDWIL